MKVVLVHDWLVGLRGGERCLEVACRLFPDADLLTLVRVPGSTAPAIERMRITTSFLQKLPAVSRYYRWLLPAMPSAVERFRLPVDADLVVSFSSCVAKGVIAPPGVRHVCYCFSPMRYAWHLKDQYFGRPSGPIGRARDALLSRIRRWDLESAARVTEFVAISRTIADRIHDCYGRDASAVIYPPVDTDFYTPSNEEREDYYLFVSALVPYKRADLAIEACRRLGRRLVIIGDGPERRRIERNAGDGISVLGWRSREEIRGHLRRCRALLFPALEDFGIVPVEAQACGAPVVAFSQGGATETVLDAGGAGRGTGMFFPRQSADSLCDAIRRFERRGDRCDSRLAREQAERFSTQRFAREFSRHLRAGGGELRRARAA